MTIYDRIKSMCKDKKIPVREVEQAAGLSYGSISKWKTHKPSYESLKKVADYLGVAPQVLSGEFDYYENDETAQVAQNILEDPDLRALFDIAKDADPEDLQMVTEMLRRFRNG